MRKAIIAGNWKMNKTPAEAAALVEELKPLVKDATCDVVVCVPAVDFAAVKEAAAGSNIHLGAQNVHWKESGAYTGELSADMLKAAGVEYVIIGHSERRQYFGETDATVNQRVLAAVKAGLKVILCVGEMKAEREAGYTDALVEYQTLIALTGLTGEQVADVVIAYEPVWAIGTGRSAGPEDIMKAHTLAANLLEKHFGRVREVPLLYGGSVKPENAATILALDNVDGVLVGGASLQAESFTKIVTA